MIHVPANGGAHWAHRDRCGLSVRRSGRRLPSTTSIVVMGSCFRRNDIISPRRRKRIPPAPSPRPRGSADRWCRRSIRPGAATDRACANDLHLGGRGALREMDRPRFPADVRGRRRRSIRPAHAGWRDDNCRPARSCAAPPARDCAIGSCVVTPVGQRSVWQLSDWMQPSENMKPRAELHQSAPIAIARAMSKAVAILPAAPIRMRSRALMPISALWTKLTPSRIGMPRWSMNSSGAAPVPPSLPSTTMKSG